MNSAESGIIAIDEDGIIVMANRLAEDLLGIRAIESIGRHILDVIPHTRLMDIMKSGKPLTGQKFQGLSAPLMVNYAPVIRDGQVVGAVSVFQDFSRVEEISHELGVVKGLNRELESVIHSSYDGIWITDSEGRVLDINEAYERITGIRAREVIGRTMHELVEEGYFDQSVTVLVMKELRSITINQTVKGKKQILVTGNPIFDEDGKLFRVVTNVRDITELVSLQEQLKEEKEQTLKYKTELTHLRSLQVRDSCLVFRSKPMTQIVELAGKMAEVDSTLLITGESGTGKELVAKLIHRQGLGDASPFISINCAAIPEQLLESELFGYEGGAFTGAKKEGKPGLFELAHNGTLFLDEVAELPLTLQVKLLRCHPGQGNRPGGRHEGHPRQRPDHCRHEPRPREDAPRGHLPRGPLLQAHGRAPSRASAARPQGRHPPSRPALPRRVQPALRLSEDALAGGPGQARQLPLARKRPGAEKRHRADDRHVAGKRDRHGEPARLDLHEATPAGEGGAPEGCRRGDGALPHRGGLPGASLLEKSGRSPWCGPHHDLQKSNEIPHSGTVVAFMHLLHLCNY